MSTFVPDPNLVVGALRSINDTPCDEHYGDSCRACTAGLALPHAEAIAEMWDWTMPQAAAVQELIAAAREAHGPLTTTARLRAALNVVSA